MEDRMSKFHEKVEGRTKQIVGHMVGDNELVLEGMAQERNAGNAPSAREERSNSPQRDAQDKKPVS
jgi:uncharacterized protein YjbJ (UPF0337 family)